MARSGLRRNVLAIYAIAALALSGPARAQQSSATVVRTGYYGGYWGGYSGRFRSYYGYPAWYGGYYPWAWGGPRYPAYWYGGVPYYYPGNTYPLLSPAVGRAIVAQSPGAPNERRPVWSEVIVYPRNGQSQNQQITDRYECYRWAVSQLGYDPTSAGGGTVRRDLTDYNRAQAACLTARGYSVK